MKKILILICFVTLTALGCSATATEPTQKTKEPSAEKPFARDHPEHPHRVVRGRAPERVIEPAEHRSGVTMPAPPEIDRKLAEATQAFGKGR